MKFMWEITWAWDGERYRRSENVLLFVGDGEWNNLPRVYSSPLSMTFMWLPFVLCFNGRLLPLPAWYMVKAVRYVKGLVRR